MTTSNNSGYSLYQSELKKHFDENSKVVFLFYGSFTLLGTSWCPDCVRAMPIINEVVEEIDGTVDIEYVEVAVGNRTEWYEEDNPFRLDLDLKLTSIPTIITVPSRERLEGKSCENKDTIRNLFTSLNLIQSSEDLNKPDF